MDRKNTAGQFTHINTDGEYDRFTRFNFSDPTDNPENRWVRREEMTRYSPYGFAMESIDANNIPSSLLYGYDNSQAVAKAGNAGYYEIAFDGFEDHAGQYVSGHGHLALTPSAGTLTISNVQAHSGTKSVSVLSGQHLRLNTTIGSGVVANWVPLAGERYTFSAWVRAGNTLFTPFIRLITDPGTSGAQNLIGQFDETDNPAIEGWRKVTATFTMPPIGTPIEVQFGMTGGSAGLMFVDDVRIHPADASMVTYVYDPALHWLKAVLDDRNYATFYNYDEEGTLVQVKKETERGVMTLRTTRKNVIQ